MATTKTSQQNKKKTKSSNVFLISVIFALVISAIILLLDLLPFIQKTELKTLDLRFRLRPTLYTSPNIGYIDYDDKSIDLFGFWPWPRNRQVALVDTLKFYNSRAAGYDVFFSENSNIVFYPELLTSILERPVEYYKKFIIETKPELQKNISDYSVIDRTIYKNLLLHTLENSFKDYDSDFEQSLYNAKNIYLAKFMSFPSEDLAILPIEELLKKVRANRENFPEDKKLALAEIEKSALPDTAVSKEVIKSLFKTFDLVMPLYRFTRASAGVGFAQIVEDLDYTVRLFPLLLHYDNHLFPAIALKMVADILDFKLTDIEIQPGKYIKLKNALVYGSENNERKDIVLPVDKNCQILMNWAGHFNNTYFHFSFKTIAYYYAHIKSKELCKSAPADLEYLDIIYSNIRNFLIHEQLVEAQDIDKISAKIALAHCIEPCILKNENPEQIKSKIKIESVLNVFDEVYGSVKFSVDMLSKLEKNSELNFSELYNAANNQNLSEEQAREIFENIMWFNKQNRIKDAKPFYFPEKQTILENGKEIKVSPIYLENKILMIGLTGIGTIDLNPMPFEQNCPMVALHTNALNLLLTRQPLYFTPVWYKYLTPIILAFIIAILSMRLNALSGSIAAIIISILYTLLIWTGWTKFNTWLSFVTPMISIYLTYLIIALYKFLQSSAERKKIRNIFSTMVSPAVLKVMEDNPDLLSLKGERMPATMSFSMVNGFANVAATVAPENLTKILSFYLTPVSEIIMDYDGYIDKYEGHIIMADFGVPIADPDNPWKCAYAAVEHQLDVKAFQYYIYANYAANVYTTLGLNFGYVSAGNMGSEKKMQYTVMGDAVNVAARFMPANIIYNTRVITGGATYYKIKDFVELRKLDKLLLKGKTTPTQIYEVLGWNKEQYLKLLANKPVPESLLTRWRFAPAAKVFGYHKFWQDMEKDFSHPLIKRFREFFESQLVLNANIFELHNKIVFLELYQELNKVIEKYNITYTHQKISDYSKLFEDWLDKVIKPLLDQLKTDTNKIEEFFNVQLFENKLNNFKEKIELKENINELLLLAYSRTKEYMSKFNYDNSVAELDLFIAEYDKLSEQYRNSVQEFFDKIKLEPQEYRNMMAEIGSITEAKRKVRDIYEQSMEKYYNRQWDEAIAGFEECLKILPDDQPAITLLERTKVLKVNPPADNWQGEFIQTKK